MKSVVVEASTVAKAIEIAWLKAEKPEEYFIRVLQEHQTGFLGFGSLKAKIVLFFKNTQKSDSLFPVVLKQKEYESFFGNTQLKNPTELNVVDTQLNKNVTPGSGQQHKKKQHNNQPAKQQSQQSHPTTKQQHPQQVQQNKHTDKQQAHQQQKAAHHAAPKQIQLQTKPVQQHPKPLHNHPSNGSKTAVEKTVSEQSKQVQGKQHNEKQMQPVNQHKQQPVEQKAKIQISLNMPAKDAIKQQSQAPKKEKESLASYVDKIKVDSFPTIQPVEIKDDLVKDIAKVLKKVQSQKIVANVSRPVGSASVVEKTSDVPVVLDQKSTHNAEHSAQAASDVQGVAKTPEVMQNTAPSHVSRFKRRPLNVDSSKASGIVKKVDGI